MPQTKNDSNRTGLWERGWFCVHFQKRGSPWAPLTRGSHQWGSIQARLDNLGKTNSLETGSWFITSVEPAGTSKLTTVNAGQIYTVTNLSSMMMSEVCSQFNWLHHLPQIIISSENRMNSYNEYWWTEEGLGEFQIVSDFRQGHDRSSHGKSLFIAS